MNYNCDICSRQINTKNSVLCEDKIFCFDCYNYCGSCSMCQLGESCEFQTNPSPLPKQIMKVIRNGNMVVQQPVINPERVKLFCTECKCFSKDAQVCNKMTAKTCSNYIYYFTKEKSNEN